MNTNTYDNIHLQFTMVYTMLTFSKRHKINQCPSNTDKFWLKIKEENEENEIWIQKLSKQILPVAWCTQMENLVIQM